jgi:hypothetical protein
MKKRKSFFMVLGALSLGMMAALPAGASVAAEHSWIWSGTGLVTLIDADSLNTDADDSFSLLVGAQSFTAISQGHMLAQFNQPEMTFINFGFPSAPAPGTPIPIEYGFSFTDGANTYYTYSVEQLSSKAYLLRNSATGMSINLQSENVTASHVPIPGAVLLLGSGLMGLVGFGARKKKSILGKKILAVK